MKKISFQVALLCVLSYLMFTAAAGQDNTQKNAPTFNQDLSWSPDGKKISFSANSGSGYDIYIAGTDSSSVKKITDDPKGDLWSAWSPDGKKIVFCSNRDGSNTMFTMKADGSGQQKLVDKLVFFARWSPDGRKIAFISGQYPSTEIYIMKANGTDMIRLIK